MEQIAFDNGMFHISYTNLATITVDIAALFFLLGMIPNTHAYRRRGRLSDRLFFAMLWTDVIMAVSDAAVDVLTESSFAFAPGATLFFGSMLNLFYGFICCFLMLYLLCLLPGGEELVAKRYRISLIPAVLTGICIFINAFTGFMFYVDRTTGDYLHGPLYYLLAVETVIYGLVGLWVLWRVNRLGIFLFFLLLLSRLILEYLFISVSSTAFVFAVVLVYLLVGAMNRSFYKEV